MARAKRTDRAEARRRYRAEVAESETVALEDADDADESAAEGRPAGRKADQSSSRRQQRPNQTARADAGAAPQTPRPGFTSVLRAATRPWNLRSDLAYIPELVLHTRAVWIPALATVATGAYFLVTYTPGAAVSNGIAVFLFQLFIIPPTIAGPFMAGILAPRATYIAGGIASLIAVIVFAVVLATASIEGLATSVDPAAPVAPVDRIAVIIQSFVISVPFGLLIGGAGGYYRRFLNLSGAGARRRQEQQARQARTSPRKR